MEELLPLNLYPPNFNTLILTEAVSDAAKSLSISSSFITNQFCACTVLVLIQEFQWNYFNTTLPLKA